MNLEETEYNRGKSEDARRAAAGKTDSEKEASSQKGSI